MAAAVEIFDDLAAEQDRIEKLLAALDDEAWTSSTWRRRKRPSSPASEGSASQRCSRPRLPA